jgi:hypothetical protein
MTQQLRRYRLLRMASDDLSTRELLGRRISHLQASLAEPDRHAHCPPPPLLLVARRR